MFFFIANSPTTRARATTRLKEAQAVRMAEQRYRNMPPGSSINELTVGDRFKFRDKSLPTTT